MAVSLAKVSDGAAVRESVPVAAEPLKMIAGMPAERLPGALIRVNGARMGGLPVRALHVGYARTVWITADGKRHGARRLPTLRAALRYVVRNGLFSGVGKLR